MPALTKIIKQSLSNSSSGRQNNKDPGRTLASSEACSELRFEDFYKLRSRLAKGTFGAVYVTQHILSGQEYAVKVIERAKLSEKELTSAQREVSILKDCRDVENIVQLVDYFVSPEHFFVVQVYARGGDVFERLAQRSSYTEADARNLAKHLLQTMDVLHSRKIAHRDLKPENLLLRDKLDDSSIVVADFGFASYVPPGGLRTRCGTPAFVGPEVLLPNCRYDERVDMWSVGCLLYMLIAGYPPFQDHDHRGLFKKVKGADYVFHDAYWHNVSVHAKRLIASLLTVDPNFRCTAREALDTSQWLELDADLLKEHNLQASLGEIRKFHSRRTLLKGAMQSVVSTIRTKAKSAGEAEFSSDHIDDDYDRDGTDADLKEDDLRSRDQLVRETSDSILLSTSRPVASFYDVYETRDLIHQGQTSRVYECVKRGTNEVYAVKIIDRNEQSKKNVTGRTMAETVLHEVAILDQLRHGNIIQINEFFEDSDHFFLLMERMRGGDVFKRLMRLKRYAEEDARGLARRLLSAVAYFHAQGIVHRDLKPQILLLKSNNDGMDVKISDFGFACRICTPQSLTVRCGTPSYVAPEVLKNIPYDQGADMWSVGVILYVLMSGAPPFVDENQSVLFQKIRMGEWGFEGKEEWNGVSEQAKDLIRGLLVPNPLQRLTAEQALQCDWLKEEIETEVESATQEEPSNDKRDFLERNSRLGNTFQATRGDLAKPGKEAADQNKEDTGHQPWRQIEI